MAWPQAIETGSGQHSVAERLREVKEGTPICKNEQGAYIQNTKKVGYEKLFFFFTDKNLSL